jgi:hypothetical protein
MLHRTNRARWFPETLRDVDKIGDYEPVTHSTEEIKQKARRDWRQYYPLGYLGEPHRAEAGKADI